MAKNKFASKITIVLIYAVVEWILMLLLLFNNIFSSLIIKYAEFFGVERPCPWCAVNMDTDLVCEAHANQISKLGYCSNHRKLGLSQDMCLHCLQSEKCSMFTLVMKGFGVIQNEKEEVGESLKCCCCCGVRLDHCNTSRVSSRVLLHKINCGVGEEEDGILQLKEKFGTVEEKETSIMKENSPQKLQFFIHWDDDDDEDRVEDQGFNNRIIFDFDMNVEMHLDERTASSSEEVAQIDTDENEADVSIGTEIPDIDNVEDQESVPSHNSSANPGEEDNRGLVVVKEKMLEFQLEEDDWVPNTPASADSHNRFHRNSTFLDENSFDSEESADGSVTSELEGNVTIERLKSALRAERKSLEALYAELEEERRASAEAVDQAMAMINRLQEEKAALQMEAFQYQRMMEEQSEYDQETLHLMNELMVKREKELEVCRKKLLHYETKGKMRVFTCSTNGEECPTDSEEEWVSILAELKVLQAKLMLLNGENEAQYEDVEEIPEENGVWICDRIEVEA